MQDQAGSDVKFELAASPDEVRFLVQNRLEILRVFRGLAHRRELVSAFFNAGNELLLTSVLDVDSDQNMVILDYSSNDALNKRILSSERIIFATTLDSVKVQFISTHIDTVVYEGNQAFRIQVPNQVLRLQRRECYRLTTPIVSPVKCTIPTAEGMTVEVMLFDISAGGVGISMSHGEDAVFENGAVYPGCRIELPKIGVVEATLRIQNTFEVTLKNGHKSLRSGCQFVDLRPAMQSLIQRYILKLERERIANAPGH